MENNPKPEIALLRDTSFPLGRTLLFLLEIALAMIGLTAVFGIICIVIWLLASHGYSMKFVAQDYQLHSKALISQALSSAPTFWAQGISDLATAGYVLWRLPSVARRSWPELGLRKPTRRDLGVGAIGAVIAFVASGVLGAIIEQVTHHHPQQEIISIIENLPGRDIPLVVVVAVVIAPFAEELIFRGFLYNALKRYSSVPVAAVVSSIIFGAVHGDVTLIPELGSVAVVLALVYEYTGCIWTNIFCHALFNAIPTILIFGFHQTS